MNVTMAHTNTAMMVLSKQKRFDRVDQIAKLRNAMVRARQVKKSRITGIQVDCYA